MTKLTNQTASNRHDPSLEILYNRIDWLRTKHRRLLYLYYSQGLSFRQLADLINQNPRTLSRHIRKLAKNLVQSPYKTTKRHPSEFTQTEKNIAYDHYLLGLGYRTIATRYNITKHQARTTLKTINKKVASCHEIINKSPKRERRDS